MEQVESIEKTESLNKSEISPIESAQARELLESTDNILREGLGGLSAEEKLSQFRNLESKCAEIEGRMPRAIESAPLEHGDFKSADEKVILDKEALSIMPNITAENLLALKKEVFSHASELSGGKNVAFSSIRTECYGCSGSCRGDCAGSTKCYSTKS